MGCQKLTYWSKTEIPTVRDYPKSDLQKIRGSKTLTPKNSIKNVCNYTGFGVSLDGRTQSSSEYRYGFQGQEMDDEIKGAGNSVNYKYRMHDPRVGRFFSIDPLTKEYPHYTPYSFSGNRVIDCIELEGAEEFHYTLTFKDNDKTKPIKSDFKKVENWLLKDVFGDYVSYETHITYQGETYTFNGKWADGKLSDAFIADPDNPMWKNSIYNDNARLKLQEEIEGVLDIIPLGIVKNIVTKKPEGIVYERIDKNKKIKK